MVRKSTSPARLRAFKAAAVLAAALLILAAAEVALRAKAWSARRRWLRAIEAPAPSNPAAQVWMGDLLLPAPATGMFYTLKPGSAGMFYGAAIKLNSRGFRGPEFSIDKPPGSFRVVSIGDSVCFGWGVEEAKTYTRVAEGLLRVSRGGEVEMINLGTPTYNAAQEAALLETVAIALKPDAIVVQFNLNDALPPLYLPSKGEAPSGGLAIWGFLRGRLSGAPPPGAGFSEVSVARHERMPDGGPYLLPPESVPAEFRDCSGWAAVEAAYARMKSLADAARVPLFILIPVDELPEDVSKLAEGRSYAPLIDLANRLAIPVIDCRPAAQSLAAERKLAGADLSVRWPEDKHPNAIGHQAMAGALAEALRPLGRTRAPDGPAGDSRERSP